MTTEATQFNLEENSHLNELEFVRIKNKELIRIIPKELIESIKLSDFTPEQFYKFQEDQIENSLNLLYALIDKERKVRGFLWAHKNLINDVIFINNFSIDKMYWGKGKGMNLAIEFIGKLRKQYNAPKVCWATPNERFFLKHGFKRSKNVLMEYQE